MGENGARREEPVLEVADLRCGYGSTPVLHGVSLVVNRGEVVSLIGPNGAGKSTLIKAVLGVVPAAAGHIRLNGREITRARTDERVRQGLAVVPEGRGVLPGLSVRDNLMMGAYVQRGAGWLDQQMAYVLELFPILSERQTQPAGTLSGGEQQMLVIGRALMSRPQLLILDEPSLGLAPKVVAAIFSTISQLHESGLTILLVEQNAHMALLVSEWGYVLESGACTVADSTARLRENDLVRDIYLGAG